MCNEVKANTKIVTKPFILIVYYQYTTFFFTGFCRNDIWVQLCLGGGVSYDKCFCESICSVLQAKLLYLGLLNWFLCGRQVNPSQKKNCWREGLVPTCRLCLSSLISKLLFCSSKCCRSLSKSSIFCLKNVWTCSMYAS